MKINSHNPWHWILIALQFANSLLAVLARPFISRPEKPLVILYGHQFSGNLKALYQEWETGNYDLQLAYLSLDPDHARELEQTGVKVLRCHRPGDMLQVARAKAMVTDHGLHLLTPLLRFTDILFVDVWHGIPFKGFTPEDFRLQHRYDETWVSSPLLKTIYVDKFGFSPDKVTPLGYARVDKLFRRETPDPALRARAGIPEGSRVVLYAPTWKQDDQGRELFPFDESQDSFIGRLSETCRAHGATLVIRSHLNTSIDTRVLDNVCYCSMKEFPDTEGLLILADVLICDWSSISFDYLALDRPTIFLDVPPPFKNGFSLDEEYRFGKVATDMQALVDTLQDTLENPQSYYAAQTPKHQSVTAAVYGENTDGRGATRQLEHLRKLIIRGGQ